ncbi:DUF3667 domain-containing protein [Sphingosinicella sp. CPCC 101087]|uniref:DUF3667 domain-containing protein n=1 Tax=Sphingosinicella sp. CPCC 101087 TaxID=2497754 RepID=UPI00101C480B|nr:DUF3667 domain-containing protein [Sphingosinicella sp. CPCC 101087]
MVSDMESVGEAVTGGAIARAIEPDAGEQVERAGGNCLNCGAALNGAYCSRCGQSAHVHRTIGAFWHDLLHSVLHFEGKIWRTLPLLAWRPGELTRRYIAGERARFVSPVALFLFSVFMMFAVFSLVGGPFTSRQDALTNARTEAERDLGREQARRQTELNELRTERQQLSQRGEPTAALDDDIREIEQAIAEAGAERTRIMTLEDLSRPRAAGTQGGQAEQVETPFTGNPTGIGWIDKAIRKAKDNPALVAYKLQTNAYKFSWALIPLSVPFVWLLFLHRRRYRKYGAYDHTVFVTYSIAFMSLGLIALSLLRPLGPGKDLIELAILIVPPLHMYRQLKSAYGLTRWSALWRTFMLILFAFTAGSLFVSLLLTLGGVG